MPLISILLPVYNGGKDLHRAIKGILNQTFRDFEIIAINDGSKDESGEILESYSLRDARLKVFHQQNAGALGKTLNIAAGYATGKFLARHDADDVSHPSRMENQINYLKSHPAVGLCGTWTWYIDSKLGPLYSLEIPDNHKKLASYLHNGKNPLVHGSVMLRSELFQQVNGYRGSYAEDFDLWMRMSELTQLGMCKKVSYYFWRSTDGITTGAHSRQAALITLYKKLRAERLKFNKEISDWDTEYNKIIHNVTSGNSSRERNSSMHYSRGVHLLRTGFFLEAKQEFEVACTSEGPYANKAKRNLSLIGLAPLLRIIYRLSEIGKPSFYAKSLNTNTTLPDFAVNENNL